MTEGRAESEQEGAWRRASLADANLRRPLGGSRASNAIGRLLPSGRSRRHVPNRVPLVLRLGTVAMGYLAYAFARRRAWAVPCSIVLVAFVLRIGITGVAWNHLVALIVCCLLLCATLLLLRHRLDITLRVMMFVIGSLSAIFAALSLHQ